MGVARESEDEPDCFIRRWVWKTALAFEANGALYSSAHRILAQMDSVMRSDVLRISNRLMPWFQAMLAQQECVEFSRSVAASPMPRKNTVASDGHRLRRVSLPTGRREGLSLAGILAGTPGP